MPPKVRELIERLEREGFKSRGGKGSHQNFEHAKLLAPVTISGKLGEDAQPYQVKAVKRAIEALNRGRK